MNQAGAREVRPNLPPDCKVFGYLYTSDDARELGQDMIDVVLPNGIVVCGGWQPEGNPDGKYVVAAYRGLELVSGPLEFDNAEDASKHISRITSQLITRS